MCQAIEWEAARAEDVARRARDEMMAALREANRRLRSSGACAAWLAGADERTQDVAAGVNGPLFEQLLQKMGISDTSCVEAFRSGFAFLSLYHSLGMRVLSRQRHGNRKYGWRRAYTAAKTGGQDEQ